MLPAYAYSTQPLFTHEKPNRKYNLLWDNFSIDFFRDVFMKAILVEGVAGSGKTSYIADDVRDRLIPGQALLLTFSRTGRAVLQHYLAQRNVKDCFVHTIDGFALQLLKQLGDTRFLLSRQRIEQELLPELYRYVSEQMANYAQTIGEEIFLPSESPRLMQELMSDIDFYRASCAFEQDDEAILEEMLAGKLNHDWRLIRRLFAAYDNYRETWHPNLSEQDQDLLEYHDEFPHTHGEQGFRSLGETVYDLLAYVEDSDILEKIGAKYSQHFIDEFHDTTPLQLRFLLQLAKRTHYVLAVGDRFQNIFAWRGTNTDIVFEQFKHQLNAQTQYLNHSYRYGQSIANLAHHIIHRPIESKASHSSSIHTIEAHQLAKLDREAVIITQDVVSQIKAAFALFSHGKQKIAFGIHHTIGVAILNILCVLRYDYLLDPKSKLIKNIGIDFAQFLQLPQCLLSYSAKQEMLKKPSLESIRMYFDIHLGISDEPAYQHDLHQTLLAWMSLANQENNLVYDIMCWFEKNARLWSIHSHRLYDRIALSSWEALKEDSRIHHYTLAQWPERVNQLNRRWSDREGIRFATVSQAKGREYDDVLVYDAQRDGFAQGIRDELSRHQFYVAITRAKKQLSFCACHAQQTQAPQKTTTKTSLNTHDHPAVNEKKRLALEALADIKTQLKKRV